MQQWRGDELPGIGVAHTLIGNPEIHPNESRLPPFNKNLGHKKCRHRRDQAQ